MLFHRVLCPVSCVVLYLLRTPSSVLIRIGLKVIRTAYQTTVHTVQFGCILVGNPVLLLSGSQSPSPSACCNNNEGKDFRHQNDACFNDCLAKLRPTDGFACPFVLRTVSHGREQRPFQLPFHAVGLTHRPLTSRYAHHPVCDPSTMTEWRSLSPFLIPPPPH